MPSFLDFLTQGQTPPASTSTTDVQNNVPAWYNSYLSSLATNAASIASTPYQSYDAARIAPQDAQETQAYDYLGKNANNWQSPLQQAQGAAGSVAGGFNRQQFDQYLNPYTGAMNDEISRLGMRNLNENLMPALNDQFIGSGQRNGPMSDRNMAMDERLVRDVGADITGKQATALQGSYANAMQGYNAGQSTTNQAAQNLGGLAQAQQAMTTGEAGALSASGQTNRGYGQANYDLAYQDFQNQMNYPRQNVSFLSSALRGANIPTSQDTTTTAPFSGSMSPSPLATFAGMYGLGRSIDPSTGQPVPRRKAGGYVRLAGGGMPMGGLAAMRSPAALPMRPRSRMAMPPLQAPVRMRRGGLERMAA